MMPAFCRDSIVYTIGTLVSRGIGLLLLPLVTHILSPAEYGAFELIVTLGVLVNLVAPLEISQALARLWNERANGEPRRRLVSTAWTFTLASHAAFATLCGLSAASMAQALFGDAGYAGAVRAGGCAIALNGVFYLLQNQFRWELQPRAYVGVSIAYALINFVFVVVLAGWLGAGLEGVLWAQGAAAAGASIISLVQLRRSFELRISRDELREMLRFSLPLVPAGIAIFATLYVNRLMLNALTTLQEVGLFGVASRVASVMSLLLVGVQAALGPLIYSQHQEPETPVRLARLLEGFGAVSLAICLALGLFGAELLRLLTAEDYSEAAAAVGWLAFAALLSQLYVFTPGIAIAKKTHWQMAITFGSAATSVALNALLIPIWGLGGATLATVGAGAVYCAAWVAASQQLYPLPLRAGPLITAVALFVPLALTAHFIDAAMSFGVTRGLAKVGVLAVFIGVLCAIGLIRPREWSRSLEAAR